MIADYTAAAERALDEAALDALAAAPVAEPAASRLADLAIATTRRQS